jgi:hypothetical protein
MTADKDPLRVEVEPIAVAIEIGDRAQALADDFLQRGARCEAVVEQRDRDRTPGQRRCQPLEVGLVE